MADVTTNGTKPASCNDEHIEFSRGPAECRPFTIFFGSLQRVNSGAAGYNRNRVSTIPVVLVVQPNPRRVAMELWLNPALAGGNVILATVLNPGGFAQCMLVENNNNRLVIEPDSAFITSGIYAAYEAAADSTSDAIAITGWEWILA